VTDHRDRFPRFDDDYRQLWVSSGLWIDRTLHDLFDERVAAEPDRPAIVTAGARYTFLEFKQESDALARGLQLAGVEPGHIVAVQLPNLPELCLLQLALSRVGAVIQPVHMTHRAREVSSLLRFCESDFVVLTDAFEGFEYLESLRSIRDDLPSLRRTIVVGDDAHGPAEVGFAEVVDLGRGRADIDVVVSPDDVFYLNFTSGTEGQPKGFLHTHNTLISLFKRVADFLRASDPDGVILCSSPMTHSFGHFTTYQMALAGIPMVLVAKYRPLELLELIQRERVTSLSGTPAHLIGLLRHERFADFDTSSITSVGVGGARSPKELLDEIRQVWGVASQNTYGMGENVVHTRTMPFDPPDKIATTVGRPLPGVELRIVDEWRRDLPSGEVGEIAFRGPTLFAGYHRRDDLTAATRDAEGWFYTGDLGSVDDDGYLTVAGRRKEMINRGGTKIFPIEIENLLDAHPDVEDVAVVGMPDFRLGERVCAYVVPRAGSEVTLDGLAAFLEQQHVSRSLVPEHLVVVEQLPMTPTGKVQKIALIEDAARRAEKAGQPA
jgi:non-ribosomal peptide synthetase component E (peptide arylation enzyme)